MRQSPPRVRDLEDKVKLSVRSPVMQEWNEQEAKLSSFRNKDYSLVALRESQMRGSQVASRQLHLVLRPGWGEHSQSKSLRAQLRVSQVFIECLLSQAGCERIGLLSRSLHSHSRRQIISM